jgi:4-oxalomesaconate tautomerase
MRQTLIPYMQFRGGSSKGVYFLASDLPEDKTRRDQVLLSALGRDASQIDGLGGANALTSKVAVVSKSNSSGVDLDYLFVQVVVGENRVDIRPNCGNILAGVGPFAIEAGLLEASDGETKVKINMLNSGKICELILQTPNRMMTYEGDTQIDGVSGTSAPIICNYSDTAGSACGSLLPTGNVIDEVDGIELTCIDNGMPVAVLRASDLNITGYETPDELNANDQLAQALESIRLQIGPKMNLGDVEGTAVPKICMISSPRSGGLVNTRTFIPYKCHPAIGVLGAVSVATACILPGSVATGLPKVGNHQISDLVGSKVCSTAVLIEHPLGAISVTLEVDHGGILPKIKSAGLIRTARLLSRGELYVS